MSENKKLIVAFDNVTNLYCFKTHYGAYNSELWVNNQKVKEIANKDCCLFMWVTSPLLDEGIKVLEDWGFKYKTVAFVWSKYTNKGKLVSNLGRWTMGNVELCILGVKGKPNSWRIDKSIKQLVQAERTIHSRKPNEVRERIVNLLGNRSKIELFAREKVENWDAWGNEVECDIDLMAAIADKERGQKK